MPENQAIPIPDQFNAPIEGDTRGPEEQSPDEEQAAKLVERLFAEAKAARDSLDTKWTEFYRAFLGDQWKEQRPSYRHSEVINLLFSEVHTLVPLMTDNRPIVETIPEDPSDFEFSGIINKLLSSKWDRDLYNYILAEGIIDASVYGTGIGTVPWDKNRLDGLGDYDFFMMDPFTFFPDPHAWDVNHKTSAYCVTAEPEDPAVIRADYPHKAKLITAGDLGELSLSTTGRGQSHLRDDIRFRNPTDRRTMVLDPEHTHGEKSESILKLTLFYKDPSVIEQKVNKEGEPERFRKVKKYPNGRKIVTANGITLEDGPLPFDDGNFPFARLVDHAMPREFWGIGEVEMQLSPQRIINKLVSYILDVLILTGNPIWLVDTDSGVDTDNLFNAPGAVVEKEPGSQVERVEGTNLQPFIFETLKYFVERVRSKISRLDDVSRGAAPFGQASGDAIEALQEAAQTTVRGKSRNMEAFLTQIGQMMFSRIMQYYSAPRVIRLTGDENDGKYFKFRVEMEPVVDEKGEQVLDEVTGEPMEKRVATVQEMSIGEDGVQESEERRFEVKGTMDIRFKAGTQLPLQKARDEKRAMEFYKVGIFDEEDLLNEVDIPNKDKILAKIQKRKQMAAEQQVLTGQPPQAPQQAQGGQ